MVGRAVTTRTPVRDGTAVLPVLMYHSVSALRAGPLRELAVPPHRLAEHLDALTAAGYRLVGLTEALDLTRSGTPTPPLVALTFDDGFANFLHRALPLLTATGSSATLYPAVGHLGGPADWLGRWAGVFGRLLPLSALPEVAAAGVEIGNHGLVHQPLDMLPPGLLNQQLTDSRDRLEQVLGRPVRSFCYPHGYHDRRVRELVHRSGHDNACAVGRRLYRPGPAGRTDDRFAVPRLQPTPDHTGADLLDLVRGGGPRLIPEAKRLAQPAWRLTRRLARLAGRRLT
ncbi:polysaccharide deacetylase family protein [Solwaraspora sp. WMMD1047]|uniref:polysaccharide deacetylase family protein n=1 Tax=Solwaraspora sp. WMMD1047 TaxID=3016102 RepID=UPI0024171B27|nr:polysaccharide deacetylase family protein [Solwaraspora sp. WMMD1047]MDG4830332.1 polysaccharide deacetylase family protein [Solwaraspora sp. WMMD1047]